MYEAHCKAQVFLSHMHFTNAKSTPSFCCLPFYSLVLWSLAKNVSFITTANNEMALQMPCGVSLTAKNGNLLIYFQQHLMVCAVDASLPITLIKITVKPEKSIIVFCWRFWEREKKWVFT